MPLNFAPASSKKSAKPTSRMSSAFVGQLRKSMEQSYIDLEPFRRKRNELIDEFVGMHYSDNGSKVEIPVNNIHTGVEIYTLLLAANNPAVTINTDVPELRSLAADWEVVTNNLIEEVGLKYRMRRWVRDAIFSVGILKTGIAVADDSYTLAGEDVPLTEAFVANVSLDDFGFDTRAKEYEKIRYAFDRYQIRMETLERMGVSKELLAQLTPATDRSTFNRGENTAADITLQTPSHGDDELHPVVNVFDVWLPFEKRVITIADDQLDEVLIDREWTGRRHGPYRLLGFSEVPDNVMPLGIAQLWRDMHQLINSLYRKLFRQASRQKINTILPEGNEEEGDMIANSNDGDILYSHDPNQVKQVMQGGIDQGNLAFAIHVDDRLNRQAGNLDALAGLGPQSETVGQDQMIRGTINAKLNKMSEVLTDQACEVAKDLSFIWWTDPVRTYEGLRPLQVPNVQLGVPIGPDLQGLSPSHRADAEKWFLFNFSVEPFSMRYRSPEERLAELDATLDRLGPYQQNLAEQGIVVDFEEYIKLRSKLTSNSDILRMIAFTNSPPESSKMRGEAPPMAPVTKRINERVNRPGGTRQGRDAAMFQSLLGKPPQQASGAAVMRPIG
jgi:hypothetical protein